MAVWQQRGRWAKGRKLASQGSAQSAGEQQAGTWRRMGGQVALRDGLPTQAGGRAQRPRWCCEAYKSEMEKNVGQYGSMQGHQPVQDFPRALLQGRDQSSSLGASTSSSSSSSSSSSRCCASSGAPPPSRPSAAVSLAMVCRSARLRITRNSSIALCRQSAGAGVSHMCEGVCFHAGRGCRVAAGGIGR